MSSGAVQSECSARAVDLARNRFPSKAAAFHADWRPPLLLFHGLLGSSSNFRSLAVSEAFNARRAVVTADLRNHGRSPHTATMTWEDMACDVREAVVREAGEGRRAHIVGHSLGGKAVMAAALLFPDVVQSLTVVDAAPVHYDPHGPQWEEVQQIMRIASSSDPARWATREEADRALRDKGIAVPDRRAFVLQNLLPRPHGGGYYWRCNVPLLFDRLEYFATFLPAPAPASTAPARSPPTLFLAGGRSKYLIADMHHEIERFFPGAAVQVVPEAGHWVHADQPAEFLRRISSFIDQHD
jgi:pimeloyl-ACP methyl ester carboxylesterase